MGDQPADNNADHASQQAENHGFDQELQQDIPPACPDRLAQADLARALGDRGQHDIHDADPTHSQRDACDAAQEDGQGIGHLGRGAQDVLLADDAEVIRSGSGVVPRPQHIGDATDHRCDFIRAGNLHADVANYIGASEAILAGQAGLRRRERDNYLVILVEEPAAALAGQHADHPVRLAVHAHVLPHHSRRAAKQRFSDRAP